MEPKLHRGEIIGRGDVASALLEMELKDMLYFASGVSNSLETRESEYQREKKLILSQDRDKHIVYFGSLSIFYADTRYTQHKKDMEQLVKDEFEKNTIVRLGNITWGTNPHTLINALKDRVKNSEPFEIRDVTRYMIDKPEFQHWMSLVPEWNCELNITGQPMKVSEIVKKYVLT